MMLLVGSSALYAQSLVTGHISDKDGQVLPGVNVLKKGTTSGTSTDASGNYSLQAESSDILVISFIGYQSQEIAVGNRSTINVQMEEDVATLNEVVVIGYGSQEKGDLTGAISSISGEALRGSITATVDQALQGRVAGVQVTQKLRTTWWCSINPHSWN
jgi:hypothetical protein